MRRRFAISLSLALTSSAVILWLVAAPTVSAGDPCYHGVAIPSPTVESGSDVELEPCAFAPTVTRVATGATVTFHNGTEFTHLVTGANQTWGSRDVEIRPGASVAYTFDAPGIYPYSCALHRGMSGAIVVGSVADASGGNAAGGAAPGASVGGPPAGGTTPGVAGSRAPAGAGIDGLALAALAAGAVLVVGGGVVLVSRRSRRPDRASAGSGTV